MDQNQSQTSKMIYSQKQLRSVKRLIRRKRMSLRVMTSKKKETSVPMSANVGKRICLSVITLG